MNYKPASLWRRLAALVYDLFLLFGLLFAATALLTIFTQGQAIAPGNYLYSVYLAMVCFLFYGWCWTHSGQTLGMQAWKIKVVQNNGQLLGWSQALLRFSSAGLSWLALGCGYWWMLVDKQQRTWHDYLSKTIVVSLKN